MKMKKIQSSKVSWLLGFKVSKIHTQFIIVGGYSSQITKLQFSCFLEDIDGIFKVCKNYLTDLEDLSAHAFSNICKNNYFQMMTSPKKNILRK